MDFCERVCYIQKYPLDKIHPLDLKSKPCSTIEYPVTIQLRVYPVTMLNNRVSRTDRYVNDIYSFRPFKSTSLANLDLILPSSSSYMSPMSVLPCSLLFFFSWSHISRVYWLVDAGEYPGALGEYPTIGLHNKKNFITDLPHLNLNKS